MMARATDLILVLVVSGLIVWDIAAAVVSMRATITRRARAFSAPLAAVPWGAGFVVGHIWGVPGVAIPLAPYAIAISAVAIAAGVSFINRLVRMESEQFAAYMTPVYVLIGAVNGNMIWGPPGL
jgi:hypothetical protein